MTAGVYYILNERAGRIYIGSSVFVEGRIANHRAKLRSGKHHSKRLQEDWQQYGEDAFVFSLLVDVATQPGVRHEALLLEQEAFWIGLYRATSEDGYNTKSPKWDGGGYFWQKRDEQLGIAKTRAVVETMLLEKYGPEALEQYRAWRQANGL